MASLSIDKQKILEIIQEDGLLSRCFQQFESRSQQQEMMSDVIEAYNENQITLIEAGTGTGKSVAYLIPALLWSLQHNERTVISTHTIALQEQLIHKDLPQLTKALNLNLKSVLVKGMNNYICLRKLKEAQEELRLMENVEEDELHKIEGWAQKTGDGSRTDLPFVPTPMTWERVSAESDTCNRKGCPFFDSCFFFKARKSAKEAQILVVNHHLLFADLSLRGLENNYDDDEILPSYTRLVIDEAHHLEDIATEHFAAKFSRIELMRLMSRLAGEKHIKTQGKLSLLKDKLTSHYRQNIPSRATVIFDRLNVELPAMRRDLIQLMADLFQRFESFIEMVSQSENDNERESKLRLLQRHQQHPFWMQEIAPKAQHFSDSLKHYVQALQSMDSDIKGLDDKPLNELIDGVRHEIRALAFRLEGSALNLDSFISQKTVENRVRWIEIHWLKTLANVHLVNAELDIAQSLIKFLFSKFSTIILCSATLTTNRHFDFVRKRLGLTAGLFKEKIVKENRYDSPFDYHRQAMLVVPTDIPQPNDPLFLKAAVEAIFNALQASSGNAFVLFTSYQMLKNCYEQLFERLKVLHFSVMKQGDDNRQSLLNRFKTTSKSVLFATNSFWEGVDVVGEALRCVIIVKLPFQVPSEPMIQARTEAILSQGGDPFLEYSIPAAIVKFKQGFGRLIRTKSDRGCVVCLDSRLLTKGYGQLFLNSLPVCQQVFADSVFLQKQMVDFYKRTHPTSETWSVTGSNR